MSKLKSIMRRRAVERDREIVRRSASIQQITESLGDRLVADMQQRRGVAVAVERFDDAIIDLAGALEKLLRGVLTWSWDMVTDAMMQALPVNFWVARHFPVYWLKEATAVAPTEPPDWDSIFDDAVSDDKKRDILKELEFSPPTREEVQRIIDSTSANDGLSAMQRIKTVSTIEKEELRAIMTSVMSTPPEGASAINVFRKQILGLVDGVKYKAQRIARTEGVRVAEDAQRRMYEEDDDIIGGVEWVSAHVPDSREDHIAQEGKYYRQGKGVFVRSDGHPLQDIPYGPNCLCWTTPFLPDDIENALPPENLPMYKAGYERFQREKAALAV